MNYLASNFTLGIIGGGQLGKMLCQVTSRLSINTNILDPSDDSPCKNLCSSFSVGNLMDFQSVYEFGKQCDLVTFEIEHINVDALDELEKMGKKVYPRPDTLRVIQDKNQQKNFFKNNEIPTSDFKYFKCLDHLAIAIDKNEINFPCVWKKTKFGYDGFGVKVLKSLVDIETLPDSEMIIEEFVPFEKELSVIVARNPSGEIKCYNTVEMEFNKDSNQVEYVISPANISDTINKRAQDLAIRLSNSLDSIGLLAVEMFLTNNSCLLYTSPSPRDATLSRMPSSA